MASNGLNCNGNYICNVTYGWNSSGPFGLLLGLEGRSLVAMGGSPWLAWH